MGPLPATPGCDCHICRAEDHYSAEDRWAIDTVLRAGWQVVAVSDHAKCGCATHDDTHDHAAERPRRSATSR